MDITYLYSYTGHTDMVTGSGTSIQASCNPQTQLKQHGQSQSIEIQLDLGPSPPAHTLLLSFSHVYL